MRRNPRRTRTTIGLAAHTIAVWIGSAGLGPGRRRRTDQRYADGVYNRVKYSATMRWAENCQCDMRMLLAIMVRHTDWWS